MQYCYQITVLRLCDTRLSLVILVQHLKKLLFLQCTLSTPILMTGTKRNSIKGNLTLKVISISFLIIEWYTFKFVSKVMDYFSGYQYRGVVISNLYEK